MAPCSSLIQCHLSLSIASAHSSVSPRVPRSLLSSSVALVPATSRVSRRSPCHVSRRQCHASSIWIVFQASASRDADIWDCVVVGAGISGLSAAQALMTRHADVAKKVLVTEARERVGGNITTVSSPDGKYTWEEGPNSFQPSDPMLRCVVDSGAKSDLVLADPDAPRFVFWGGELLKVPGGLPDLPFFRLLSPLGKIRAGLGALGLFRPGSFRRDVEESVEQFVRRNLGNQVFERLIEPFCSGVYAGDPAKLSMKAAFGRVWRLEDIGGSIVGGTIKLLQEKKKNPPPPRDTDLPKPKGQTVGSFQKGLITLPKALQQSIPEDAIRVNWQLQSISKAPSSDSSSDHLYELQYSTSQGNVSLLTRTVLLTVPSYVAAEILKPHSALLASSLSQIYYPPVAAVTLSYPRTAILPSRLAADGSLPGFGQLHPRSQGVTTLGTLYSSSLFPGRCPDDEVLLLNYIGGVTNTGIVDKESSELVATIDTELRRMLLAPNAPPPKLIGIRLWERAIPQFQIGHLDQVETATKELTRVGMSGVFLGGNYVYGVALGRCVEGGREQADDVAKALRG